MELKIELFESAADANRRALEEKINKVNADRIEMIAALEKMEEYGIVSKMEMKQRLEAILATSRKQLGFLYSCSGAESSKPEQESERKTEAMHRAVDSTWMDTVSLRSPIGHGGTGK